MKTRIVFTKDNVEKLERTRGVIKSLLDNPDFVSVELTFNGNPHTVAEELTSLVERQSKYKVTQNNESYPDGVIRISFGSEPLDISTALPRS
jgi:hypothetical protein